MKRSLDLAIRATTLIACLACISCTPQANAPEVSSATQSQGAAKPVHLRWSMKSEPRVYGYLVMRATSEKGPFLRLNELIVLAAEGGAGDAGYEFIDADVESGKTYFYLLEAVSTNGSKTRLGDVIRRKVD